MYLAMFSYNIILYHCFVDGVGEIIAGVVQHDVWLPELVDVNAEHFDVVMFCCIPL